MYDGDQWMIRVGDRTIATGKFTIDSTKKPKEIDILDESGLKNGQTKLGIFELDGDTYRYCLAPAGKPRPTRSVTSVDPGSRNSPGVKPWPDRAESDTSTARTSDRARIIFRTGASEARGRCAVTNCVPRARRS